MSFSFREVVVSGTKDGTEGTSKCLNEIVDVMVNGMGWVMEEDRRLESGSTNVTLTHKVVFNSNGGESLDQSNWFFTITSGTVAAPGSDLLGLQIATAYDTGTHDTAASGVETPLGHTTLTVPVDSNGNFVLWVSGDKDGVVFVTHVRGVYGYAIIGRGQHFVDNSIEPFGLYINSNASSTTVTSTTCRSIAGQPPQAFQNASEGEILGYSLGAINEPRVGLGSGETFFTAVPLVHTVDDGTPLRKGAVGLVSNAWSCAPATAGWVRETVITVSGSPNRQYIAFPDVSTNGIVIRKN